MIQTTDSHDLQLEDVEDFSADYPTGYPHAEQNLAAVGSQEDVPKKSRVNRFVYLIRKHKWVTALSFVIVVIAIVLFAIVGGTSRAVSSGTHGAPIHIDPKSLDPRITAQLMEDLISIYSRKELDTAALAADSGVTAQKKAFYWLAANEGVLDLDHTKLAQRYAMAVFYYATNAVATPRTEKPFPWVSADLWLSVSHVCEWQGIVCNEQDHIEEINLERNNLTGSLPPELAIISSTLHTLDLTSNLIYMVDDMYNVFSVLTQLQTLLMDDNYLIYDYGLPSQFKSLERLQKVRLSYNLLAGVLERDHKVLPSWTQLTHLELESNYLSGTLPTVIGEMTNLVYIYMRRNDLKFNLNFLKSGKLKDLFTLWLDDNKITGTIPTELGLLTELASISLTNATLHGKIPTELGMLSGLRRLWLYSNTLTGSVPAELNNLSALEVLQVHNNSLTGAMPQGICSIIDKAPYELKSLTSDCLEKVTCDSSCCTECY